MRKILFRGRDHAGKWHKGSLIVVRVEKPTHKDVKPYEAYIIKEQTPDGEEYLVDYETIGQLVFPATKIHPDIWEGDIIEDEDGYLMEVMFDPHSHTFYVIVHSEMSKVSESLDENYIDFKFKYSNAKVVGNIHDPELINDHNRKVTKKV